jgi:hypothetical protein
MKLIYLSIILLFTYSCSLIENKNCEVPSHLLNELSKITQQDKTTIEEFNRINNLLYQLAAADSLNGLSNCNDYINSIPILFNSPDSNKRTLGYRLIGLAKDTNFNAELINRINSDENTLLKSWCSTALMETKAPNSAEPLFKLFASPPDKFPVSLLINRYITYDIESVKKTSWKYIDSSNRTEQILAIQILSYYEKDEKLQDKLTEFLSSWEMDSKGWVISAMAQQKMADLKPILEQYLENDDLKDVIIMALENSPTKTDNEFAKKLNK